MIAREPHARSRRGITLTEILIAIMILGVGLVSLATLFPIGLLRLRDADPILADQVPGRVGGRRRHGPVALPLSSDGTVAGC